MVEKSQSEKNIIYFYRPEENYGEFSNFYSAPVEINFKVWPTNEHFFQAMKFEGKSKEERIRKCSTPGMAFSEGRKRDVPLRSDWEEVKDEITMTALRAKFTQHEKLKMVLLSTKDNLIIEHTKKDNYWADAGDGTGKNMLGILLMKLRDELKEKKG